MRGKQRKDFFRAFRIHINRLKDNKSELLKNELYGWVNGICFAGYITTNTMHRLKRIVRSSNGTDLLELSSTQNNTNEIQPTDNHIEALAKEAQKYMFKVNFLYEDKEHGYRLVMAENRDTASEKFTEYMKDYTNEKISIGIIEDIDGSGKLIY